MVRRLHVIAIIGIGVILGGLWCSGPAEPDTCPDLVDSDYTLQFILRGGGVYHKLALNEDGTVEASARRYLDSGSAIWQVVSDSVSSQVRYVWLDRLNDIGFFCLDDYYPPATQWMDVSFYKLTVVSRGKTKTVTAEDRGGHPAALHELFWDLYYDLYVPVYRDSAKVGTLSIWQEYKVLPWPFTDVAPLTDNVYTEYFFSEIDSTGEIARYLSDLYSPDSNYNKDIGYLHLEGDYLYGIKMIDNGIKVLPPHPVRYWPEELGVSLGDIPAEGVIVRDEVFRQVKALFIEPLYVNSVFVESLTAEVLLAYHLILVNGVAVD